MTPQDFQAWRKARGESRAASAAALGISQATIKLYEAGRRFDDGRPVEIPLAVQLACAALTHGLSPADALKEPRARKSKTRSG